MAEPRDSFTLDYCEPRVLTGGCFLVVIVNVSVEELEAFMSSRNAKMFCNISCRLLIEEALKECPSSHHPCEDSTADMSWSWVELGSS
jgi:hypothetical protein